jgi:poly(hydroxyalkanoate) depolymerase family esterase
MRVITKAAFGELRDFATLRGATPLDGRSRPARPAPVPDGSTMAWRRFACAAGARDYRLFVPSSRDQAMQGVVVMLHGCTQSPEDFALGTRMDLAAEKAGFVVAYPAQTALHNAQSCWNWFRPQDQAPDAGEPAILAGLASQLAAEFGVGDRVYAAGLSFGGAMAAVLADTHPDLFAAVGVHSGLPAGSAHDVTSAFAAMRGGGATAVRPKVPAIVFHGRADAVVSVRNAVALAPGDGVETPGGDGRRTWTTLSTNDGCELWLVDGAGHAWFGGDPAGSYTDPAGPDASGETLRFFSQNGRGS